MGRTVWKPEKPCECESETSTRAYALPSKLSTPVDSRARRAGNRYESGAWHDGCVVQRPMTAEPPRLGTETNLAQLWPRLLKLARRYAGRADAEDLVQEALARALERWESLRPETDLQAWMRPVIRNLAIDQNRKRSRFRGLEEARSPSTSPVSQAPAWTAFDTGDVRRALEHCPQELRMTFELHYWQLLPLESIATRLGVPRATVGTRLFRARAHVRRALERSAPPALREAGARAFEPELF